MGNEQAKGNFHGYPEGIATMDQKLQEKFSKGIQFNMKIVIRGERNSGKTALFQRLQGGKFLEAYIPTEEIQVGTIIWGYKGTNDKVKVEIWDVVDKGKPKKRTSSILKGFQKPQTPKESDESPPLDAAFLDVYKNTHGVIFIFDMCKKWTWQYIEREVPAVPYHIPIIIIGNFRDMESHRTTLTDEALGFIEYLERPEGSANIRYCETSMKDCFGLSYLHKFFSIPFLQMQQEVLLQQLQENRLQMQLTLDELEYKAESTDFSYVRYTELIQKRANERKEQMSQVSPSTTAPVKGKEESEKAQKPSNDSVSPTVASQGKTVAGKKGAVERGSLVDFLPEGHLEEEFLGDDSDQKDDVDGAEESDSDDQGNPLVAGDEDLDSDEVTEVQPPPASTPPVVIQESAKGKLKQVKDIRLTESESEESVEDDKTEAQVPQTKTSTSGGFSFDIPFTSKEVLQPDVATQPKKTGTSSGLLLSFDTEEKLELGEEPVSEETVEKVKKKKKSSKKSRHEKERRTDPMLPSDSLDAWLGEPDDLDDNSKDEEVKKKKKKPKRDGKTKKKRTKQDSKTEEGTLGDYDLL